MAGVDIQAKVKRGLRKAIAKTGSSTSPLVYLINVTGGGGTPSNPVAPTKDAVLLEDAIFKDVSKTNSSGQFDDLIQSGDQLLVSNGDVVISTSDTIQAGANEYFVVDVAIANPAGIPLSYTSLLRSR